MKTITTKMTNINNNIFIIIFQDGNTALTIGCMVGNVPIVSYLIDNDADTTYKNKVRKE